MNGRIVIRAAVFIIAAAVLLAVGLYGLDRYDRSREMEVETAVSEDFGMLRRVTWNGITYREKPAVTTILITGIDKTDTAEPSTGFGYRNGGQADFLLLVAIDHTEKKIHPLQIDRDTMADVEVLGVFGNEAGTRNMQICLAHSYGATPEECARRTVRAVQNLLDGMKIDGYYVIDYSAVPVLNEALGGVTVTVPEDMTGVDAAWEKGSSITLHGGEAETFVRTRKTVGSGTNEERMSRQTEYLRSVFDQAGRKLADDALFGDKLIGMLRPYAVTNFSDASLLEELSKAHGYELLPVDHPAGDYTLGTDGFMEFHMKEDAAKTWALEHLYTKV